MLFRSFLRRERGLARGLALAGAAARALGAGLPVLGRVPAGPPSEAMESAEERLSLDRSVARGADYVLRVKGDSMEPEIQEGDLVLVKQAADADDGEVVVAHVGAEAGEATVKRLRGKGRSPILEAANPKYAPIPGPFTVVGRVVGLVRTYAR